MEQQVKYGIPASVTLAQMALESRWGKSDLAITDNNYFGIKCPEQWLKSGKPYSLHNDDKPNEKFCHFNSPEEALEFRSKLLTDPQGRFKRCLNNSCTDYEGWVTDIKACGYATDPSYVSSLLKTIRSNDLTKYDTQAVELAANQNLTIGYGRAGEDVTYHLSADASTQQAGVQQNQTQPIVVNPAAWSFPLRCVNQPLVITSDYGHRSKPTAGASSDHKGIDIQADSKSIVMATENNGKVVNTGYERAGGNFVTVEYTHADNQRYQVTYLHLDSVSVKTGDMVNARQEIAKSGNTGTATTGPHLHMSVKQADADGTFQTIDPKEYLAQVAVYGGFPTQVTMANSDKDLLAEYKQNVKAIQPQNDLVNATPLSNITGSTNEKTWMDWMLSAAGNGDGVIDTILSNIFPMAFTLAAKLQYDNAELAETAAEINGKAQPQSEEEGYTILRSRESVDVNRAQQTASMAYDANSPEESQGNGLKMA